MICLLVLIVIVEVEKTNYLIIKLSKVTIKKVLTNKLISISSDEQRMFDLT